MIADEAWEVDHYWHEHPELKRTQLVWFTDFVGFLPMPGRRAEAFLTADYNAEMIGHVEQHPPCATAQSSWAGRTTSSRTGSATTCRAMRDWIPAHFDFSGYILGEHPARFRTREALRERFG